MNNKEKAIGNKAKNYPGMNIKLFSSITILEENVKILQYRS